MVKNPRNIRSFNDPTPEEIRRQTEAIRQTWSEHERVRRAHFKPTHWMPPVLAASQLPELISDSENQ